MREIGRRSLRCLIIFRSDSVTTPGYPGHISSQLFVVDEADGQESSYVSAGQWCFHGVRMLGSGRHLH